jgi:hypothetical protein
MTVTPQCQALYTIIMPVEELFFVHPELMWVEFLEYYFENK